MVSGHDGRCYFCGEDTNSLGGNPGKWPVYLGNEIKHSHVSCVTKRLRLLPKIGEILATHGFICNSDYFVEAIDMLAKMGAISVTTPFPKN